MTEPAQQRTRVRRAARSVEGAAIAGIVFAAGFTAGQILMTRAPGVDATRAEVVRFYSDPGEIRLILIGLQVVPIAMIGLLWFIAVVRRRIGEREDKLFSTVFLGGGLMFTALVLVGTALLGAPAIVADLGSGLPDPGGTLLLRGAGTALFVVHAPRLGSLFILSASTLGLRTGAFPRVISYLGYLLGLALIVPLPLISSIRWVFPAWVGIISFFMLIRHRDVRQAASEAGPGDAADSPLDGPPAPGPADEGPEAPAG